MNIRTLREIGGGILGYLLVFLCFSLLYGLCHYVERSKEEPLTKAVRNRDIREVARLLKAGAEVNTSDKIPPLHYASEHGTKEIVELLLHYGADANSRTRYDVTPLHFAAQGGNISIAELLIQFGAQIGAEDHEGRTPLDWIARREWASPDMIEFLELQEDALWIWKVVKSEEEYDRAVEKLKHEKEFRELKNRIIKRSEKEFQQYITKLKDIR